MLHSSTLNAIRKMLEGILTDTCAIERRTMVADSYGAQVATWAAVRTECPCRLITDGSTKYMPAEHGKQLVYPELIRLILPVNADIQIGDRVILSDDTYSVSEIRQRRTDAVDIQVLITRYRGEEAS